MSGKVIEMKDGQVSGLLNTSQAAKVLGVSKHTLQNWRVKGGSPIYIKDPVSRIVRYRLSDLHAWIKAREATSTSSVSENLGRETLQSAPD